MFTLGIITTIVALYFLIFYASQTRELRDALLETTKALPAGALTANSDALQVHSTPTNAGFFVGAEAVITIPALTTAQLPDGQTITYSIQSDLLSSFGSGVSIGPTVVQTGAGGAGAAAAELRVAIPSNVEAWLRAVAVKTGAADASGASMVFSIKL